MSNLELFFLKKLFRAYNFFIFAEMYQRTSSEFLLNFRFSRRKSQSQQKLAKKIAHFTIQSCLKNIFHFTNLETHLILKIICSRNTAKNLSDFKNFPADMFLLGVREYTCTVPFLDAQELSFWSTLKENVCIFLYISVRKIFSKYVVRFYLMGVGWGKAE